jgi:hypothetical protein
MFGLIIINVIRVICLTYKTPKVTEFFGFLLDKESSVYETLNKFNDGLCSLSEFEFRKQSKLHSTMIYLGTDLNKSRELLSDQEFKESLLEFRNQKCVITGLKFTGRNQSALVATFKFVDDSLDQKYTIMANKHEKNAPTLHITLGNIKKNKDKFVNKQADFEKEIKDHEFDLRIQLINVTDHTQYDIKQEIN